MSRYYVLDGHTPVGTDDIEVWGKFMEDPVRVVAKTHIGKKLVSTVFLGLDHAFGGGRPLLFETMVFNQRDEMMRRYSTWDEAVAGHAEACEIVRARAKRNAQRKRKGYL